MKGPVLQSTVYSDKPYVRTFNDLDVLLSIDQALAFHSYLLNHEGFEINKRYLTNYESWYKAGVKMSQHLIPLNTEYGTIEIHHRLHQFFMTAYPNTHIIFENAYKISSKWGSMLIPDKYDMFIMLCYHMYYHNCYENEIKLSLHVDIIYTLKYIKTSEPADWIKRLWNRIQEHGLFDVVSYCIVHSYQIFDKFGFGSSIEKEVLAMFVNEETIHKSEEIHSRFMLCEQTYGYWQIPYLKRIFIDKRIIEKEVAYEIYHRQIVEKWEPILHSLDIYDLHPQSDGHYW